MRRARAAQEKTSCEEVKTSWTPPFPMPIAGGLRAARTALHDHRPPSLPPLPCPRHRVLGAERGQDQSRRFVDVGSTTMRGDCITVPVIYQNLRTRIAT